jgi:hypothetical protein
MYFIFIFIYNIKVCEIILYLLDQYTGERSGASRNGKAISLH